MRGVDVGAPLRGRNQLAQQQAELLHPEDRHAVGGRCAECEAAVGFTYRVGEVRAAGDDKRGVALAELAERRAQFAQRVVAGSAAEPAAELDDGQHRRAASNAASAAAGATSVPAAPHEAGASATARPRRTVS